MTQAFPPPAAFGLPEKFEAWRPDQLIAFQRILDSGARFIALTLPAGVGKSLMYMTAAALTPGRSVVLTSTKGLQDQIQEFTPMGLVDLRGQANYPCRAFQLDQEWSHLKPKDRVGSCEEGPCRSGLPCTLREAGCDYYDRVRLFAGSRLGSTNYALWLAQKQYGQGLGSVDLLVLDEAHQAEEELGRALQIRLDKADLAQVGVEAKGQTGIGHWKSWASYHADRLRAKLDQSPHASKQALYLHRKMQGVERALRSLAGVVSVDWVEDHVPEAWVFEVVRPARYAEPYLFQGAKKVVLTSATLTEKTTSLLGIPPDAVDRWECPSPFPVGRRPIYYIQDPFTVRVDQRMTPAHRSAWATGISQVVAGRPGVKGIIHTVSYRRAEQLVAGVADNHRLLIPAQGKVAQDVALFKDTKQPLFLVSPALSTGWDFPDDDCRVIIIAKLPFPDTRSKILQARAQIDDAYLPYLMAQRLVQSTGRGMRHELDWCETFIRDAHWEWVRKKYLDLFPQWFLAAIRVVKTIPPPLGVSLGKGG